LAAPQILVPKFRSDCHLSQGVEVGDLLKVRKEALLYVQPCSSERGKLMADIEFGRETEGEFIDPRELCSLLEIHRRRFAELKCSEKLGVAKFKWRGREISIFKNGKLKIQRAVDRDEILRVANSVSRLVWGATICGVCGQPTLNCASGKCGQCATGEKVAVDIGETPNAELLLQGYKNLERARDLPSESAALIGRARYLALHFAIEAPSKEHAAFGLVLLGESEKLESELKSKT
jgi:hypothetical protein